MTERHQYYTRSADHNPEHNIVTELVEDNSVDETSQQNPTMSEPVDRTLSQTQLFLEKGKLLELTGKDLRDFVLEQEERQERLAREERQERIAREERQDRREERERNLRLEELHFQAEIARATVETDGARAAQNQNNNRNDRHRDTDNYQTKLPFQEDKDDVEAFLLQFERHAEASHWDVATWPVRLSPLLRGKARIAYTRMRDADALNFTLLKKTLLESQDYCGNIPRTLPKHSERTERLLQRVHHSNLFVSRPLG